MPRNMLGGGSKGDLYVQVRINPHKTFSREGDVILSEEHIGMADAALGAELDVKTVDGTITMKVPAGTVEAHGNTRFVDVHSGSSDVDGLDCSCVPMWQKVNRAARCHRDALA